MVPFGDGENLHPKERTYNSVFIKHKTTGTCFLPRINGRTKIYSVVFRIRMVWVGKTLKDHPVPTMESICPLYYLKPFELVRVKSKSPDPQRTA